ncbi:MAG: hypothetical protein HKP44_16145 [Desulfofustis sp.]|nr:hypothetical protein [Desulfofustis sp.]
MSTTEVKSTSSEDRQEAPTKRRRILLQFLVICLPLWLSFKFYNGPYSEQVGTYLSGILLLIICALAIQLILPTLREAPLLIVLFLIFSAIELLFWQKPGLVENFSITLGKVTLIGDAFSVNRIPYYGVGAFIGYFVLKACRAS